MAWSTVTPGVIGQHEVSMQWPITLGHDSGQFVLRSSRTDDAKVTSGEIAGIRTCPDDGERGPPGECHRVPGHDCPPGCP